MNDPERAVRETCEIAIAKIEWDATPEGQAEAARRETEKKEAEENGTIRYARRQLIMQLPDDPI